MPLPQRTTNKLFMWPHTNLTIFEYCNRKFHDDQYAKTLGILICTLIFEFYCVHAPNNNLLMTAAPHANETQKKRRKQLGKFENEIIDIQFSSLFFAHKAKSKMWKIHYRHTCVACHILVNSNCTPMRVGHHLNGKYTK